MWTPTTRRQYSRDGLRYETDLTDAEWALIEPLLPEPRARGRPRRWPTREILNAIFYVLRGGIAWRLLPSDLPPKSTVFRWFSLWRDTGLFETINHLLVMADRERVGREASPTAAVLDSQSVKTTESGGPRGYDAGKKVKGRKRQVMVDTDGRGLILEPQPADVQDRDGACVVLRLSRRSFPFIVKAFADSGYAGEAPGPGHLDHHRDRQKAARPGWVCGAPSPLDCAPPYNLASFGFEWSAVVARESLPRSLRNTGSLAQLRQHPPPGPRTGTGGDAHGPIDARSRSWWRGSPSRARGSARSAWPRHTPGSSPSPARSSEPASKPRQRPSPSRPQRGGLSMAECRAAFYARVSSEAQARDKTIASQVAALRERIAADGVTMLPDAAYIDEGHSGSSLVRPALERLRDAVAAGDIDRVYVLAPDRLARRHAHQALLMEEFRRAGVEVAFLNRPIGASPEDDLLLQIQGVIAEYERAQILERGRRGRRHAARSGSVSALAGAPYGYRYITRERGGGVARFEIVPEEARFVRLIFAWVGLDRLSLREVCRRLQQAECRTRSGTTRWWASTLHGMIENPAYTGTVRPELSETHHT